MATARKTIHARPRHLGKIHNRPRFDGVFDAVTITVYYWKNYQAYLVLIGDKVLLSLVSMKSKKLLYEFIYINIRVNKKEEIYPPKYKKYLIWPIKYFKQYKSTEYMKSTILSINMIGNGKQKTWQKNTIFKSKMLKGLCPC